MNEVQVIKRNDTSDVPKYLPMILAALADGIPYEELKKEHKYLPTRSAIWQWKRRQSDSVRQEILNLTKEARESGADSLDALAMEIARSPVYDAEDAAIKEKQVKMLLMVSRRIAPRETNETAYLEKVKEAAIVQETVYPAMTKEQAMALLKSKEDKK